MIGEHVYQDLGQPGPNRTAHNCIEFALSALAAASSGGSIAHSSVDDRAQPDQAADEHDDKRYIL